MVYDAILTAESHLSEFTHNLQLFISAFYELHNLYLSISEVWSKAKVFGLFSFLFIYIFRTLKVSTQKFSFLDNSSADSITRIAINPVRAAFMTWNSTRLHLSARMGYVDNPHKRKKWHHKIKKLSPIFRLNCSPLACEVRRPQQWVIHQETQESAKRRGMQP